jgi:hypothetical protein
MTTMRVPGLAPASVPTTVAVRRVAGRLRAATWLSLLVLVSVVGSSAVGLVVDGVYGDPASTASMLRGYDLVTLVIVAPLLAVALLGVRRGSPRAHLLWVGMLAAVVYTYAYYLFGTGFSDAFLVHAVVFSAALFALVLALSGLDVDGVAERVSRRTPVRWIAGLLAFLAVGLGGMWIFHALRFAVTGQLPEGSALVEEPTVAHLGFALDLAVLVPAYALAAVLLWRRAPWGYVLAALMLISGTVHQLGYLVALPFQVAAGVPGATAFDPLEPPIAAAFLVAAVALLAGLRRSHGSTAVASVLDR